MKTDKFWMSAIWGRIGAAVVLIVGTILQGRGVDVTQEQMDGANNIIGNLIDNVHVVIAASMMLISKLRENSKATHSAGQSGQISMGIVLVFALGCAIVLGTLAGCAPNQSATQQLLQRTSDPGTIALGTFADAQDAYIEAQELYRPYQAALKQSNPDLDAEIISYFRKANVILNNWEMYGDVPRTDQDKFRQYLRDITIGVAQRIESK